ncbi:MAG: universal stress protein [Dokdonia sp.]|jgi:nucleotide-binding universal stress UspA family protein|nr:universal stress protein UspA [Cytophagaceae bacterium]
MKHILIPTDFSENAQKALAYAVHLMKHEVCTFYVLNTFTPASIYATTVYDTQGAIQQGLGAVYKERSEKKLQREIDIVKEWYADKDHHFVKLASYNLLLHEIKEMVDQYSIDFIVMGTQGASGLKEIFLGSQTMHTIKNAKVPVLCVPAQANCKEPKEIVFATDYNLSLENKGISLVRDICQKHSSRLVFLNAYYGIDLDESQVETKSALDQYFKASAHLFQQSDGMDVLEALKDFDSRHNIDLLVMIHNKHSFFENLLFTPVINTLVHHITQPFLVIPSLNNH